MNGVRATCGTEPRLRDLPDRFLLSWLRLLVAAGRHAPPVGNVKFTLAERDIPAECERAIEMLVRSATPCRASKRYFRYPSSSGWRFVWHVSDSAWATYDEAIASMRVKPSMLCSGRRKSCKVFGAQPSWPKLC